MSLIRETEKYLKDVINNLGYDIEEVVLVRSNLPQFGQFQINCAMSLAKKYGKNPRELAQEIVEKLDNRFVNVNIAGPGFINISLRTY